MRNVIPPFCIPFLYVYSSRWDKKEDTSKAKDDKKEANGDASSKEKSSAGKSPKRDGSPKEAVTAPLTTAPAVKQEKVEPPPKKERSDRGERGHSRDRKGGRRSDR